MIWSIVLAAGAATRYGRIIPKQYEALGDRRVIDWSLDAARQVSDGVVLVVGPDHIGDEADPRVDRTTLGGDSRSASVRNGLSEVPEAATIVVVHDAARPLAGPELFREVIRSIRGGADAAVPVVALVDTVKRVDDGIVIETLARDDLVAVQTPQAFRADALRAAHGGGGEATDDATLVEENGGRVAVVDGSPSNIKITVPTDLAVAEVLLG